MTARAAVVRIGCQVRFASVKCIFITIYEVLKTCKAAFAVNTNRLGISDGRSGISTRPTVLWIGFEITAATGTLRPPGILARKNIHIRPDRFTAWL